MRSRAATFIFALATPCAFSQPTIENPRHVDIPEAQARVLYQMSFQAVAKELRPGQKTNAEFPLRLVIGQEEERFGLDARTGVATLFLREWDAVKFTTAAVRFAIQRSVRPEREEAMISEILHHSQAVAPVSTAQLRGSNPASSSVASACNWLCQRHLRCRGQRIAVPDGPRQSRRASQVV